jgi:hypothetical protein
MRHEALGKELRPVLRSAKNSADIHRDISLDKRTSHLETDVTISDYRIRFLAAQKQAVGH